MIPVLTFVACLAFATLVELTQNGSIRWRWGKKVDPNGIQVRVYLGIFNIWWWRFTPRKFIKFHWAWN